MQWKEFKEENCSFLEKRHGQVRSYGKSLWGYFFCPFLGKEPVFRNGLNHRNKNPQAVEEEGSMERTPLFLHRKALSGNPGSCLGTLKGPLSFRIWKTQAFRATRLTSRRSFMMIVLPSTRMSPSFSRFASSRERDGRWTPRVSAQYFLVKGISTTRVPRPE